MTQPERRQQARRSATERCFTSSKFVSWREKIRDSNHYLANPYDGKRGVRIGSMFVALFLKELSDSIARAGPKPAPSREGRSREKSKGRSREKTEDRSRERTAARSREKRKVDGRRREPAPPDQPLESLAAELERLLSRNRPHQVPVLRARLGIDGPRTTLEVASRLAGMTRERARQIESKFLAQFLGSPAATGLIERIGRLRHATDGPLFLRDLPSKDPWFGGFAAESEVLLPLLEVASGSDLRFVATPMGAVVAPRSIASWQELLDVAVKLAGQHRPGTSRRAVRKSVTGILRERKAPELLEILLTTVESNMQYSSSGTLVAFGRTRAAIVETILEDSDRPLHYSEVARRWSERAGRPITAHSAHAALEHSPNVYLLGRGIHGLAKHIGLTPAAIERLIADCEAIVMTEAPKKQWHTRELLEALKTNGRAAGKVDKYVINACLSRSSALESVGRLVWVVRRAPPRTTADRLDLQDVAVQALERAGHPLRQDELRQQMERSRGVGEIFQIFPTERMATTAPGTWGLLERDFVLTELHRKAVGDAIYDAAVKQGFAVHISELPEVLATIEIPPEATSYMIRQLAGRDSRLRLFMGDFIGLREWEDARRPTWRQAMEQIAGSLEAPVTLDWIHGELEKLARRSLSRVYLYSLLRGSGLTVNPGQTRGPHRRNATEASTNNLPSEPA